MAQADRIIFYVGAGTCGLAAGASEVLEQLLVEVKSRGLDAEVKTVGCMGFCEREPIVDVRLPGSSRLSFANVDKKGLLRILDSYVAQGIIPGELLLGTALGEAPLTALVEPEPKAQAKQVSVPRMEELPFLSKQCRRVLSNCGKIDPESMEEYVAEGGYEALRKAIENSPQWVIDQMKASQLRGRGGAGFPTGLKWALTAVEKADRKYVVCNADEGDPGAFMDRSLLEGDPHRVLEGILVAGYAVGAQKAYVYARAEYPLAIARLENAIKQLTEAGYLGDRIMGSDFSFSIELKMGAGAFVCGEETALLASVEGERGIPRPKPPFPAAKGLWGYPTLINNVETFANVADIIARGPEWFANVGTERSKGTKVFSLTGKVKNSGLIEVPMGMTLREVVFDLGGGVANGRQFKAAQIGGPSGGCMPAKLLDTPIDYDSLLQAGAMMGSGGLVVMDDHTCMVEVARFFLGFVKAESCGRCTPCREGTTRLYEMLQRVVTPQRVLDAETERIPAEIRGMLGMDEPLDPEAFLATLRELAEVVKDTSACGLGQTAPNPVLSTLRHFEEEYRAHLLDQVCPAGACKQFLTYTIDAEKCTGCGLCKSECPATAISGERRKPHAIDQELCVRCGNCVDTCSFGAITGRSVQTTLVG
ncbi:MAG: NADH-ubiquinone oxidoreductase-F iron-sulfur binding region domain-containing protein [Limnochordia bacterium]|jgi:NADH-quinone oxidoreductase subunit F